MAALLLAVGVLSGLRGSPPVLSQTPSDCFKNNDPISRYFFIDPVQVSELCQTLGLDSAYRGPAGAEAFGWHAGVKATYWRQGAPITRELRGWMEPDGSIHYDECAAMKLEVQADLPDPNCLEFSDVLEVNAKLEGTFTASDGFTYTLYPSSIQYFVDVAQSDVTVRQHPCGVIDQEYCGPLLVEGSLGNPQPVLVPLKYHDPAITYTCFPEPAAIERTLTVHVNRSDDNCSGSLEAWYKGAPGAEEFAWEAAFEATYRAAEDPNVFVVHTAWLHTDGTASSTNCAVIGVSAAGAQEVGAQCETYFNDLEVTVQMVSEFDDPQWHFVLDESSLGYVLTPDPATRAFPIQCGTVPLTGCDLSALQGSLVPPTVTADLDFNNAGNPLLEHKQLTIHVDEQDGFCQNRLDDALYRGPASAPSHGWHVILGAKYEDGPGGDPLGPTAQATIDSDGNVIDCYRCDLLGVMANAPATDACGAQRFNDYTIDLEVMTEAISYPGNQTHALQSVSYRIDTFQSDVVVHASDCNDPAALVPCGPWLSGRSGTFPAGDNQLITETFNFSETPAISKDLTIHLDRANIAFNPSGQPFCNIVDQAGYRLPTSTDPLGEHGWFVEMRADYTPAGGGAPRTLLATMPADSVPINDPTGALFISSALATSSTCTPTRFNDYKVTVGALLSFTEGAQTFNLVQGTLRYTIKTALSIQAAFSWTCERGNLRPANNCGTQPDWGQDVTAFFPLGQSVTQAFKFFGALDDDRLMVVTIDPDTEYPCFGNDCPSGPNNPHMSDAWQGTGLDPRRGWFTTIRAPYLDPATGETRFVRFGIDGDGIPFSEGDPNHELAFSVVDDEFLCPSGGSSYRIFTGPIEEFNTDPCPDLGPRFDGFHLSAFVSQSWPGEPRFKLRADVPGDVLTRPSFEVDIDKSKVKVFEVFVCGNGQCDPIEGCDFIPPPPDPCSRQELVICDNHRYRNRVLQGAPAGNACYGFSNSTNEDLHFMYIRP